MNLKTKMERLIQNSYGNMAGMVVKKKGDIVYEKYYNGYTEDNPIHIFSVTKSIVSILIGIALDKKLIHSVNDKVLDYFPDYEVKRGEKTIQEITLYHLMTMTAPYRQKKDNYTEFFTSDDWVRYALDHLGGRDKIGEFRYAPLIGPDILTGILVKVTGKSVLEFATEELFVPLGIVVDGNVRFRDKEEQLAWYEKRDVKGWVADPQGVNTAGWGLTLKVRDMVKIGQLYLAGGAYDGRKIVSEDWVKECTTVKSRWEKMGYGYLWWIIDEKERCYAGLGDGGNVIYVNEAKEMVVAIGSVFDKGAKDRVKLIREYVEKVF